jgi:hypothetical protein
VNTNRDVILVDLSNIRDQTGEKARTEKGLVPTFSRSYLDGFEDALRRTAPFAHIVFVAGRAIISKDLWIEGGKRQSTDFKWMKHRTKSKGESDFVYLMQEQKDGEEHIKADELILHLARQFAGFIVSNDNYRDPEYRDLLREVGHKHFGPKYDYPSDSWSFELKYHDQVDLIQRSAGFLLEECLTSFSILDQEEEEAFGHYLYEIAIPDFWSERDNYTLDSKKSITQKIADFIGSARVVNVPQVKISGAGASVISGLSAFEIRHLRRERMSNKFVELFGRTKTYGDQIFLEGIPGDKAVLLEGFGEILNPNTGFLQITGKLRFEDNQAILKHRGSSVVVEIDMKRALKIVGTVRVSNRNRENYVRWVMKPLPWEHRKTRTSAESKPDAPLTEIEADEPKIEVEANEPKTNGEKKTIGDPLIRLMMEDEKITSDPNVDEESGKNPAREKQVRELLDPIRPERGTWELDSKSKYVIVVALAVIAVVAALWMRDTSVDNGCQDSNTCVEGSDSPAPVLDPARTKWVYHSREKVWVRG